jgi:hypothetical protein
MADLSEEGKAEIAAAVAILRSDGLHIHKTYAEFQKGLKPEGEGKPPEEETEGKPPPEKGKENDPETPPAKKSLWWGNQ